MNKDRIMALADRYRDLKVGEGTQQARAALLEALDAADREVERLTALQYRQAPCHKFCEANAFTMEIRALKAENEKLQVDIANIKEVEFPRRLDKVAKPIIDERDALKAENAKLRDIARLHYGHAKGYYMNKCNSCEKQMEFVDKRCYRCVECADKAIDAARAALGDSNGNG